MRGATAHFDAVVSAATSGVLSAGLDAGIPVIFCVMTTDTMEQVDPLLVLLMAVDTVTLISLAAQALSGINTRADC